jgi:hypothetical protein
LNIKLLPPKFRLSKYVNHLIRTIQKIKFESLEREPSIEKWLISAYFCSKTKLRVNIYYSPKAICENQSVNKYNTIVFLTVFLTLFLRKLSCLLLVLSQAATASRERLKRQKNTPNDTKTKVAFHR